MLYAILCYEDEKAVSRWTAEEDAACMARLDAAQQPLRDQARLGAVLRLQNTTAAATLRKNGSQPMVLDGPFAETKEQLLGLFTVDCASLDEAMAFARELAAANPGSGCYEVRPMTYYRPGALPDHAGEPGHGSSPRGEG